MASQLKVGAFVFTVAVAVASALTALTQMA